MSLAAANRVWSRQVVDSLAGAGVTFVALCPGSRSAPLALALSRQTKMAVVVHWDERAAAFMALGHSKASGQLAAVLVTSGTAVANLHPAVLEARAASVPLVVLSADRPPELLHLGANQTIDQHAIFGSLGYASLPPCDNPSMPGYGLFQMRELLSLAQREKCPVHLNLAFREPLADGSWNGPEADLLVPENKFKGRPPETSGSSPAAVVAALREALGGRRVLVAVGECAHPETRTGAAQLCRALGFPVYADILSGIRGEIGFKQLRRFDRMLGAGSVLARGAFDAVLHLGGRFVSKPFETFLAQWNPIHIHLSENHLPVNGGLSVTHRLVCPFGDLARDLVGKSLNVKPFDTEDLEQLDGRLGKITGDFLKSESPPEMALPDLLALALPDSSLLFAGNSMPVRDLSSLGHRFGPGIRVLANRGASGIDGLLATAVGAATAADLPALALLGDLSLLHDLTSLGLVARAPKAFVVLVVNNGGGGIFHFLPSSRAGAGFESHVALGHPFDFTHGAAQFHLPYHLCESAGATLEIIKNAFATNARILVELKSSREENHLAHGRLDVLIQGACQSFP